MRARNKAWLEEILGDNRIGKVSLVGIGMALARRHRGEDVQGAGRCGHQHPDDLRRRRSRQSVIIDESISSLAVSDAAQGVRARQGAGRYLISEWIAL
jgi:hypothetical protein